MALWGKKKVPLPDQRRPSDVPADAIQLQKADGAPIWVTREEWRRNILPASVEHNWSNPEGLYNIVAGGLRDEMVAEIAPAARRLWSLKADADSACALGIVELKLGNLDAAEEVLREEISMHGDSGHVLTNLAKVHAARGDRESAMRTLWRGLEVDPNQDNALLWWEVEHRERGGPPAGRKAFEQVAALPKSWRAQIWLAREALDAKDVARAQALYEPALLLPDLPGDALMQISGDLGERGYLREALALVRPKYDPETHGWSVANNLLMAMHHLGQDAEMRAFLATLPGPPHPRWIELHLFWQGKVGLGQ